MTRTKVIPTGIERRFDEDEIIVSKTDTKGRITYVNDIFCKVSGYSEEDVIGQPHSLVRSPEMPRAVFKLLWETIESGEEIFAYVVNLAKNGDHYWVLAHVTPTLNESGSIIGYHSNRRLPDRSAVNAAISLYKLLLEEERRHSDPRKGLEASHSILVELLNKAGKPYEEFIWSIGA